MSLNHLNAGYFSMMRFRGVRSEALAAAYTSGDRLRIFDASDYSTFTVPPSGPTNTPASMCFSHDGSLFACLNGNAAEKVIVYQTNLSNNAVSWVKNAALATQASSALNVVKFSPDGSYMAVGGNITNDFIVYKTSDWTTLPIRDVSPGSNVRDITFSSDSSRMIVTSQNGYITSYSLPGVTKILGLPSVALDAKAIDVSNDGFLVSGIGNPYGSPYIKIYKESTLVADPDFVGLPPDIPTEEALRFSISGAYVGSFSTSGANALRVWAWPSRASVTVPAIAASGSSLASVSFSADDKFVAAGANGRFDVVRLSDGSIASSIVDANLSGVCTYSPY